MKTIFIASDHAGFELKNALKNFLESQEYQVIDKGPEKYDPTDDYPDFIALVAQEISENQEAKGIILGGSGQGEAMVANRFPNVRAAVFYGHSMEIIKLSREHNDANILSLGARFVDKNEAKEAVKIWLETEFSGDERHIRRIQKMENL